MSYAISLSGTTVSIASPGPRGIGVPAGGTAGQVLVKASDTNYDFDWGAGAAGIADVVDDTTPQLGGNLDVNGQSIVSVSNGNIAITPNGTGVLVLDNLNWPTADGTADQVLKTNGSGQLSFGEASTVAALNDLTDVAVGSEANKDVLIYRTGSGWINDAIDYTDVTNNVGSGTAAHSGGTVPAGSISDVIALTNTQYSNLTGGPDANTLYVITDGTTSIGDSDDVTITGTPSDHSFLVFDSATSDFINRTAAEAQADLGISAFGTTLIDDADAAAARTTLGLGTASTSATGDFVASSDASAFGLTLIDDADAAAARTTLGLGTLATQSTITDSYVGHIETIADGTYYIDVRVPAGRTLASVYLDADSGASATIDLQEGGTTMLSATASLTGGTPLEILTAATTPTISDTALAADAVLTLVVSGSSSGDNLRFAVEYTQ